MNFLAHLYLSGDFDELMVGNLMDDFVKGKPAAGLSEAIRKGIALHREIDAFTDSHPVVRASKMRLQPVYHKYAGVIVDIFYDHFLAVAWPTYSVIPLPDFAAHVYALLENHHDDLPPAMQQMFFYMRAHNWLVAYAQLEGIERVLEGMARRTRFPSHMERAGSDLRKDYHLYQAEFNDYFPQLMQYVAIGKAGLV